MAKTGHCGLTGGADRSYPKSSDHPILSEPHGGVSFEPHLHLFEACETPPKPNGSFEKAQGIRTD
jgi:hypothetical protein